MSSVSNRYLDFINIMTYDFHGAWDPFTGHNSPLYRSSVDQGENIYYNVVSKTLDKTKLSPSKSQMWNTSLVFVFKIRTLLWNTGETKELQLRNSYWVSPHMDAHFACHQELPMLEHQSVDRPLQDPTPVKLGSGPTTRSINVKHENNSTWHNLKWMQAVRCFKPRHHKLFWGCLRMIFFHSTDLHFPSRSHCPLEWWANGALCH